MKTNVCGPRDVANSSVGPLLSDGSASCSRTRSCSPSSRRTTTKTTGAGPLRLPARRPLSNTAKIRSPSWSGAESALAVRPPRFRGSRSQNQPRSLPTRHSRDCGTSVDLTALRRCELDVPKGLCPCSQGENGSILVSDPFSGLHRVFGMAALLAGPQPDGLQRVFNFGGQGLCYTPHKFGDAEATAAPGMGSIIARRPAAHR